MDSGEAEERKLTAASAQSVRLVVALAERAGTLRCCRMVSYRHHLKCVLCG